MGGIPALPKCFFLSSSNKQKNLITAHLRDKILALVTLASLASLVDIVFIVSLMSLVYIVFIVSTVAKEQSLAINRKRRKKKGE